MFHSIYGILKRSVENAESLNIGFSFRRAGVRNVQNIHTFTAHSELKILYRLAAACPEGSRVLEVGSYLGASSCYLGTAISRKKRHLFCVDTWQNETMPDGIRDTFQEFQRNTRALAKSITPIRKAMRDVEEMEAAKPFSLIFLDGDHSFNAVTSDVEKVLPWLQENGTLVFHDSNVYRGVSKEIGRLLETGDWKIKGLVGSLAWLKRATWTGAKVQ